MNYISLLNNFSTPFLQRAIEEEIIRLTFMAKIATKQFQLIDSQVNISTERWNSEITDIYRLINKVLKE